MTQPAGPASHWFRWHHGTVSDPKWRVVAMRASHAMSRKVTIGHVVAVWSAMLECASQATPRGELVGWSDEDIAACLEIEEAEVAAIREAMAGKTLDGNALVAWNARQVRREDPSAADRQRHKRERDSHGKKPGVTQPRAASRAVTTEERRGEEKEARANPSAQQAARGGDRFPEFWTVYPRKKGKAAAEKTWKAKKLDQIADQIIADVKARIAGDAQWRKEDGRYIPHGSTYLNQRGWEDDIEGAGSGSGAGLGDNLWGDAL